MIKNNNILICPLEWGLGHATRIIPIINLLLSQKQNIIIAADNQPLELLRSEFPQLKWIKFPSYKIEYSRSSMILQMLILLPKIIFGVIKEHKRLKKIIKEHNINIVISDNRFGCWNKKIYSVYITHQVMVKMPGYLKFLEYPCYLIHKFIIKKYNKCWIPDFENDNNLSGYLSHKFKIPANAEFIWPLSRFFNENQKTEKTKIPVNYDICAIISGPEPQRTLFEKIVTEKLLKSEKKSIIIRGKPKDTIIKRNKNVEIIGHAGTKKMEEIISQSNLIICRSGYSSIMDLVALKRNAILISTPGQTEQEYLAKYLKQKGLFFYLKQEKINFNIIPDEIYSKTQNFPELSYDRLKNEIKVFFMVQA